MCVEKPRIHVVGKLCFLPWLFYVKCNLFLFNFFFPFSLNVQVAILLLTEITPKSLAVHNATEVVRFVVSLDSGLWN